MGVALTPATIDEKIQKFFCARTFSYSGLNRPKRTKTPTSVSVSRRAATPTPQTAMTKSIPPMNMCLASGSVAAKEERRISKNKVESDDR
jgi:hypothetical protein